MNTLQRYKAEILADKRKAVILGGLGVVCLVLAARAMLSGGGASPQVRTTTVAMEPANHADQAAVVEERLRALMKGERDAAQPEYSERNLFALREAYFPHPAEPEPEQIESAKSVDQSDEVSAGPSDLELAAASLTLKSTLVGKRPVATVRIAGLSGGQDAVVRVGDRVSGLVVVEIDAKRIVLERDGERIELVVKDPLQR